MIFQRLEIALIFHSDIRQDVDHVKPRFGGNYTLILQCMTWPSSPPVTTEHPSPETSIHRMGPTKHTIIVRHIFKTLKHTYIYISDHRSTIIFCIFKRHSIFLRSFPAQTLPIQTYKYKPFDQNQSIDGPILADFTVIGNI